MYTVWTFLPFKVNESQYIALFVVSGYIKSFLIDFDTIYLFLIFLFNSFCQHLPSLNIFSIVFVNIYLISILFQKILPGGKMLGYPKLAISWLINFNLANSGNISMYNKQCTHHMWLDNSKCQLPKVNYCYNIWGKVFNNGQVKFVEDSL